jgi:diacylglycerol kinase (ATP)
MRANLIFNPNSGLVNGADPQDLVEALFQAGYEPVYEATSNEEDLNSLLTNPEGLMVVAGGDGSVRAVATRILGKNVPMAIVPLGTANNIAKMYNISGSTQDIISGLRNPSPILVDVGLVVAPWGDEYFMEAFGFGFYAEALKNYQPEKGKSLARSILTGLQTLKDFEPRRYELWLDEQDLSGEYLLVEVLNTNAFGPRLKAAPKADPSDGLLEVVRIDSNNRDNFIRYLVALTNDKFDELPSVSVEQGLELKIAWDNFPIHVDAEVPTTRANIDRRKFPAGGVRVSHTRTPETTIHVKMLHHSLELWLPGSEEEHV